MEIFIRLIEYTISRTNLVYFVLELRWIHKLSSKCPREQNVVQSCAVQHEREGRQVLIKETIQLPELEPGQALVRVSHAAQNPTDGKSSHGIVALNFEVSLTPYSSGIG